MSDTASPTAQHDLAAMLAEQRELTQLGLHDLVQRWVQQPDRHVIQFGAGLPAEVSIRGNPEEAFHGLLVYNTTGKSIAVSFNAGGATGSPLIVPAGIGLVWPVQYTNLSFAGEALEPTETLLVVRLRYPPSPQAFILSAQRASTIASQPLDAAVLAASVKLLGANPQRRGLTVVNTGGKAVRVMLGEEAKAKHGLWLSANGGTWDGMLGGALWLGSLFAITDSGEETTVAVVEA